MKRREFIAVLGGAAISWPLAARAQQPSPVVGFLHPGSPEQLAQQLAAFRQGLNEIGFVEGLAAKAVTTTIPIVCSLGGDAVKVGLVTQLNRPGGNITGVSILGAEMGPKRLELAHQLVPKATAFAVLINPKYSPGLAEARDMDVAAHSLGLASHRARDSGRPSGGTPGTHRLYLA
jgi:putative ABC transport system substrate-binding protein